MRFLHEPRSVAVIGASDDPDKIGGRPIRYLREFGFGGRILPVNRSREEVQGMRAYPDVSALPIVPDVALVAVPGAAAADAVAACAEIGVQGCVVFSSGFGETDDPEGRQLQERMRAVARDAGMRLVGPNSQGLANFATGAVLGFSTMFIEQPPADGPVGIVSQSGAMCSVPYGLLRRRGVGVRYAHASGNDADVGVADLAEAVLDDPEIRLLLLYVENIRDAEPLERMARRALHRNVPVVALMGGRSADGQRAARSHTGALANEERVVNAFFDSAGIWRARSMRELVDAAELYLQGWQPRGRDLTVISNSGAVCVLAADAAADHRLPLTTFAQQTTHELDAVLPRFTTTSNPVDVTAALLTDSSLLGKVLNVLVREPGADACLLGVPVAGRGYDVPRFAADAAAYALGSGRPLVVAAPQQAVADEFRRAGLVVFEEESSAVAALAQFLRHRELMAAANARPDRPRRAAAVAGAEVVLNEADSLAVLERAGLSVVPRVLCANPSETVAAFDRLDVASVALKGCTPDVTHKSDLGLVRLGLQTAEAVAHAASEVYRIAAEHALRLDGLLVAPMIDGLHEVLVGAHRDPVFGPVVVVGSGGRYVEALPDVQLLLPPFDVAEAHSAISRLRIAPLLAGVRNEPAANVDALAAAVVQVGDLMADPDCRISSLDANPVLVGARDSPGHGAVVVDAVVTTTAHPDTDS
jgi:acyl-CoA synthetase (NDP forming)